MSIEFNKKDWLKWVQNHTDKELFEIISRRIDPDRIDEALKEEYIELSK